MPLLRASKFPLDRINMGSLGCILQKSLLLEKLILEIPTDR